MTDLREAAQALLGDIQAALEAAYHNCHEECCGRPGFECCGSTIQVWSDADQRIMNILGPMERKLREALHTALAEDTVCVPRKLSAWIRSAIIEAYADHEQYYSTDGILRADRIWSAIIAAATRKE